MGVCKTTLPWGEGKTLLTYQLEQWLRVGFTPVVVLGSHNADRQKDFPDGCIAAMNFNASAGKTTSILAGLEQIPQDFPILAISAVDQPRNFKIYQKLVQAHQNHAALITAPTYQGKMGHPLLFDSKMRYVLENIQEETMGLRQVIKKFYTEIQKVEFNNHSILLDVNTPEIYYESKEREI